MDRNQAIGLVLSGLLLIVYFQFFAPDAPPPETQLAEDTVSVADTRQQAAVQEDTVATDSVQRAANEKKFGAFASVASGDAREVTINTEDLKVSFSTQGGKISEVELKDYKTYDKKPLIIIDRQSSRMDMLADTPNGKIDLRDLYYQSEAQSKAISAGDTLKVSFVADLGNGNTLTQVYAIPGNGYEIGYDLQISHPKSMLTSDELAFKWKEELKDLEQDIKESRRRTELNYYTANNDVEKFNAQGENDTKTEEVSENLQWITMKQRFFSSAIIADRPFKSAVLTIDNPAETARVVKTMTVDTKIPIVNGAASFSYYFGPNDLRLMRKVAPGFEENIDFGWMIFGWIGRFVIAPLFHFLEGFISSYGLIIILLVLIIKTVLFPLSYKSYISMGKIKVLKPELDEIKEKYGDDMQKAQTEQMQLYNKVGVNPLSGCVPTLLQMPILLAMFNFFPNSIELRQEPFLWTNDLSTYDSILQLPFTIPFYGDHVSLFVLLMTASTILITWSTNQTSTVQGPMKSMQYAMPFFFMFLLNSFPAALSFYYLISNLVTFGQQTIIRRFVDDGKIRAILDENKVRNKNKKKSKFQARLEDAMKATEEAKKTRKGKK